MPHHSPSAAPQSMILIVEDTADLRSCVSEYFRAAGFDVVASQNAQDALVEINSGVHIDLVFTDINMPGAMNGVALAHWLSVNRPGLPIVLTSGEARPDLAQQTPGLLFLRKPYDLDAVERVMRELIEQFPMQ